MIGDESLMGFGQIVPLLLLGSTVFIFKEAYDGERWLAVDYIDILR